MEKTKSRTGYIYIIENKENGMKYIGQTIRTIKRRWSAHKTESKTELNPSYFHNAILKYGEDNFKVSKICSVKKDTTNELKLELNLLEIKYISEYNTLRPNGYNLTPGGDSSSFTRQRGIVKISKKGEILSSYESIADALRDNGLPEGSLSSVLCGYTNMAHGFYWKYSDDTSLNEFIANINVPYIAKYDEFGDLVSIYEDYKEATKDNNIRTGRLKQCCNGERTHSNRFQYREYSSKDLIKKNIDSIDSRLFKQIVQYDLNNNKINTYVSIKDVLKHNPKYTESPIRNCCAGFKEKAYEYIWKYA